MTDAELSSLEAAAKTATPGPWKYEEPLIWRKLDETHWQGVDTDTPNNMAYIAAANPSVVLELIAELRQTRAERDWLANKLDSFEWPLLTTWIDAAKEATCQKN